MARYPGLMRRGTKWYLRVVVPDDIREVVGKREIWKTLGTGDYQKARGLYLEKRAEVERQFARAREGTAALSEDETRQMVVDWFRRVDRDMADADFKAHGAPLLEALEGAGVDEAVLVNGDEVEVLPTVQAVADAILIDHDWPSRPHRLGDIRTRVRLAVVDKASAQYVALCEHVRRAMVEMSRRRQDRLRGNPAGATFDPMFSGSAAGTAPAARTAAPHTGKSPRLTEILERWLAERKPPEKTKREWTTAVRRFGEVNGDLPVNAITKAHVREFKDALLKLPTVVPRRLRGKTVPQITRATAKDDTPRLSPAAVNKVLGAVRTVLGWSARNGYREGNPAAGVTVARAKNAQPKRLPYTVEDMRLIFDSIGQFREAKPSRFFLPLLAAYTGARLEELGQLTVDDVRRHGDVHYIDINAEGDGKSLKTVSSARQVPLHPELVKLGFLDYVTERRRRGGRLFPELRPDSVGTLTGNWSKWYGRHARDLGVTDPRKVFHSFRHAFKDACRAARITEEVHDALTGHVGGGVGRTYGGGVPLEVKAEEIARVRYPGLDLGHLYVRGRV